MTVSAHDVARELRRRLPDAGVAKIHKLLYYCQGWNLVLNGELMFDERIEAWANGPVVARVWADEKHARWRPNPRPIAGDHLVAIEYVMSRYGELTGRELIRATHAEPPWRDTTEADDGEEASPEIPPASLVAFFAQDPEWIERQAKVAALRRRTGIYSFDRFEWSRSELEAFQQSQARHRSAR
jgi:uncharacterized phage-associated protein